MPFDLAISEHGDLIVAGNRDLAGISGGDLLTQRILIRLRLHRGSWFYDENGTLGSFLHQIIGNSADRPIEVEARVREALSAMDDEIEIIEIDSQYDDDTKSVIVGVTYTNKGDVAGYGQETNLELQIPLGG
jgi:hypothetical protein